MYELILTMLVMYPGSSTGIQKTVLGHYETVSQCESARRHLDLRYNSSAECKKITKKNV
jgi:hypothetical protein